MQVKGSVIQLYPKIYRILLLTAFVWLLSSSVFAQKPSPKATLEQLSDVVKITVSSSSELNSTTSKKNNTLTFIITSAEIKAGEPIFSTIEKGLIDKIKITTEKEKITVTADTVSMPSWNISQKENGIIITISYTKPELSSKTKPRAIKTKNTYKPGESLLTDLSVVIDSGQKQTAPSSKKFYPYTKTAVAEIKKGFKESVGIITSKAGKPEVPQITGKKKMFDKDFLPFEKRENINMAFSNRDITEILKVLAEKTGKNLIVSPQVKGKKSIEFRDISPEEAMLRLIEPTGFEIRIQKETILVGPPVIIDSIIAQQYNISESTAKQKQVFVLKKRRGETILKSLDISYPNIKYTFHPNLNAFEVLCDPETMDDLKNFFNDIDLPPPPTKENT